MFLFVYRFVHFVCTILTTVAIFCLIISAPMDREKYKPIDGKKKKRVNVFCESTESLYFIYFISTTWSSFSKDAHGAFERDASQHGISHQ